MENSNLGLVPLGIYIIFCFTRYGQIVAVSLGILAASLSAVTASWTSPPASARPGFVPRGTSDSSSFSGRARRGIEADAGRQHRFHGYRQAQRQFPEARIFRRHVLFSRYRQPSRDHGGRKRHSRSHSHSHRRLRKDNPEHHGGSLPRRRGHRAFPRALYASGGGSHEFTGLSYPQYLVNAGIPISVIMWIVTFIWAGHVQRK